ncbi:MAG: helix-turn-helix transcriptional regulator, partial [Ruminococcus sp.]|nr:helix-turn-helix transcriptional regulator [Ruminococcus sp.]
ELAELAGISVQFLSDIENNKKSMTITTLENIAKYLCVTTDYLIYGSSNYVSNQSALDTFWDIEYLKTVDISNLTPEEKKIIFSMLSYFDNSKKNNEE